MSCRKASYIIEKRGVSKISLLERLSLRFHLLICKLCRRYESDSRVLGKLLKKIRNREGHAHLSEADKAELKRKLTSI